MKQGNADAENKVDEYYPAWKNPTGISQIITSNPSELAEVKYYSLNGTLLSAPQSFWADVWYSQKFKHKVGFVLYLCMDKLYRFLF